MKALLEYLQSGHASTSVKDVPTLTYHTTFKKWLQDWEHNNACDYDITKFLRSADTGKLNFNLYFDKSEEYLHLHKIYNKASNAEYALCMIYDCDEDFPKDSEWNHEGHCITLWRLDVRDEEEGLYETLMNGIKANLFELTR